MIIVSRYTIIIIIKLDIMCFISVNVSINSYTILYQNYFATKKVVRQSFVDIFFSQLNRLFLQQMSQLG